MRAEKPAVHHDPASPAVLDGGRWAAALGAALLIVFTAAAGFRWLGSSQRGGSEQVVQQSVPDNPSSPRPKLSAPDPGDNP